LAEYERTGLTRIFPQQWEMGRRLAKEFCSMTRLLLKILTLYLGALINALLKIQIELDITDFNFIIS